MPVLTGIGLAIFGESKKGTPYVYGAKGADGKFTKTKLNWLAANYPSTFTASYIAKATKFIGKVCTDCSGLISWYTGKVYGSSQLYSKAYARLPISEWKKFAVGTVVWKQGHVGIYIGNGLVVEAKGISYGTIISRIEDTKWTYGLTFSWIDYVIEERVPSSEITYKGKNPYAMPEVTVKKGNKGDDVRWLQWELVEAGYSISIDGSFGTKTLNALKAFQKSSKLTVDGLCGPATRRALVSEKSNNPYSVPNTVIKMGSKGAGVKWLQFELVESGYNISIDGDFGPATKSALEAFQKAAGLTIDAKCGAKTREALIAAI